MQTQLQLPLFAPDVMERVKEGHRLVEMEKLRRELEHVKHQRDGYNGAYQKLKQKFNEQVKSRVEGCQEATRPSESQMGSGESTAFD